MTSFSLKLLAMACMLLDHAGYLLFPGQPWLRLVGRIAFPVFCFQLAEGAAHTSNLPRYCRRLFLFALLSEVPFDWMIAGRPFSWDAQNVLFTLGLSALAFWVAEACGRRPVPAAAALLLAAGLAAAFRTDYGAYGVLLTGWFYAARQSRTWALLGIPVLTALFCLVPVLFPAWSAFGLSTVQLACVAACVPLALYNGRQGPRGGKYAFYCFYPLHMLLLYGVSLGV